jgi:hypothetical protein
MIPAPSANKPDGLLLLPAGHPESSIEQTRMRTRISCIRDAGADEVAYGEGVMGGKYSAEWWEKILEINREGQARHGQSFVAELVQARAKQSAPSEPAAEKPSAPQ